jgi:hypothetical protein
MMSMRGIAKYMHLSQIMDFKREREKLFHLPTGGPLRTVLMKERPAATFAATCSVRGEGSQPF